MQSKEFFGYLLKRAIMPLKIITPEKTITARAPTIAKIGCNAAREPVRVSCSSAKPERIVAK